jgi:HAD superfamily hydrolase (TIGR01509 family)
VIQTILFDFGNVIGFFDHQRAVRELQQYTDCNAEQLTSIIYHGNLEERYECGLATTDEVFSVAKQIGQLNCTQEQFVAAFCNIFWPNPPVADLIPRLKQHGYRLVLASNTNDAHYTKYRVMFANTLQHFDALGVSHEAGARKPHRPFFEYVQDLAGGTPESCLFIDDMAENIVAAREFGWQAIQYTTFDSLMLELTRLGIRQ